MTPFLLALLGTAAGFPARSTGKPALPMPVEKVHYLRFDAETYAAVTRDDMPNHTHNVTSLFESKGEALWKILQKSDPAPAFHEHFVRMRIHFKTKGVVWIDKYGYTAWNGTTRKLTPAGFKELKELIYFALPDREPIALTFRHP